MSQGIYDRVLAIMGQVARQAGSFWEVANESAVPRFRGVG